MKNPIRPLVVGAALAASFVFTLCHCGPVPSPAAIAPVVEGSEAMSLAVPGSLVARDGQLYNQAGKKVKIYGVNWFGLETGQKSLDGLWQGPDSLTMDVATITRRIKALGFNAIRVPFSMQGLYDRPSDQTRWCSAASEAAIAQSVTPPGKAAPASLPQLSAPPQWTPGTCNAYYPDERLIDRIVWTAQFFARNGLYVMLDSHLNTDPTAVDNPELWLQNWQDVLRAVSKDPVVAPRIIVDLMNEPDSRGLVWEDKNGRQGLGNLYLRALDKLYPINPKALYGFEGSSQLAVSLNWGDGLITDAATIQKHGLSDPNPFFKALLGKPYLNRIVLLPHLYPPSVSKQRSNYTGKALYDRLDLSLGYLNKKGYCSGGKCRVFPILLGEVGSNMTEGEDLKMLDSLAHYILADGEAGTGHRAFSGWFWWSWNANSGDTGGVVKDDWRSVHWHKITYMQRLGLKAE